MVLNKQSLMGPTRPHFLSYNVWWTFAGFYIGKFATYFVAGTIIEVISVGTGPFASGTTYMLWLVLPHLL